MHGETNKVNVKGTFTVKDEKITGTSTFIIKPEDYGIKIPKTVVDNIAEEIEVTVDAKLEAYKKQSICP